MKFATALLGTTLLLTTPVMAQGPFDDAEEAIAYRQAAFGLIKANFADMGAMLKKKKPMDAAQFNQRAEHLAMLSTIPFSGFITGSDRGDTAALEKIWQERQSFEEKATHFQASARALAEASRGEDPKALTEAFGAVGKSCKGCHDSFKAD